jgi:HD-like signal output (HDOD) protein
MPAKKRPNAGTVYLAGLLQQIGLLLLGHLCRTEFHLLNKVLSAHPEKEITEIEQLLLGITHPQVGAGLMRAWQMPEPVIVGIEEHHHPGYQGEHQIFVNLIQLSNILLARHEIGDSRETELPAKLLKTLGITPDDAEDALNRLMQAAPNLDVMVRYMAA